MKKREKFLFFWIFLILILLLVSFTFEIFQLTGNSVLGEFSVGAHTKDRANSYDDSWDAKWKETVDEILLTTIVGVPKTEGKVIHIGDSMTVSQAYGSWLKYGKGQTEEDTEIISWMHGKDDSSDNGFSLSAFGGTANNGMGWGDSRIDSMLRRSDVNDAQYVVYMMNTPNRGATNIDIVKKRVEDALEKGIIPILSSVPPRDVDGYDEAYSIPFRDALASYASERGIPFIDFYEEVVLRQPNDGWVGTLISNDGVHPSGTRFGYGAGSNPYADGGDPSIHLTGNATFNSGYLLRTWLTVQKMKEIKEYVDSREVGCKLTYGSWETIKALEGDLVKFYVEGSDCEGQTVDFEVFEYDSNSPDQNVSIEPNSSIIVGGRADSSWIVEYQEDSGNPEYYFIASANGSKLYSGTNVDLRLDVSQNIGENCVDLDEDGYNRSSGFSCGEIDCNDLHSTDFPGALEICGDFRDNNCNSLVDCDESSCLDFCSLKSSCEANTDLVEFWPFYESFEPLYSSRFVAYGNVSLVEGISGNGVAFDGDGDYLDLGDVIFDNSDEFSISLWAKLEDLSHDHTFFSKGVFSSSSPLLFWRDDILSGTSKEDLVSFLLNNGTGISRVDTSTGSFDDTDWHHLVATFKSGDLEGLKIYIDGKLESSASTVGFGSVVDNSDSVYIGSSKEAPLEKSFSGSLDEIAIFNMELNDSDVFELYSVGFSSFACSIEEMEKELEDVNGDGIVDIVDLINVAQSFGESDCSINEDCNGADVDMSGSINIVDLIKVAIRMIFG